MNTIDFIKLLTKFATENNTIAICNKTIQLIAAIVEEVGIDCVSAEDYEQELAFIQNQAQEIAKSLADNMNHGYLTSATCKAIVYLHHMS
jgi:hypothetical protein